MYLALYFKGFVFFVHKLMRFPAVTVKRHALVKLLKGYDSKAPVSHTFLLLCSACDLIKYRTFWKQNPALFFSHCACCVMVVCCGFSCNFFFFSFLKTNEPNTIRPVRLKQSHKSPAGCLNNVKLCFTEAEP